MEDFLCDQVIKEVRRDGEVIDVNDILISDLALILNAVLMGLSPNGRSGSRPR